jgi:hypothetical protein|tara:strand:- start:3899 stop:4549 length:651 start_codon:yes stop_codon:yes gene_type:complete
MSWTLTTLKNAVQDYTQNTETTFVNNLNNFIITTEERILKQVDLDYFRKNVTGSMSTGNKFLQVPDDYLASFSLSFTNSDAETQFLLQKDVNYIQTFTPKGNTTTGDPRFYALFDVSNFILAPTPSGDFTTELHYYYRPTSITATSDGTSWLGTNAQDAMLYGTLCEAYTFMKGDDDLFKIYLARFQESLLRLKDYGEARENSDAYRQGLVSTRRT